MPDLLFFTLRVAVYAWSMVDTLPVHHLTRVLSLLRRGAIVGFPTGTTYGLGVNALDPHALERLRNLKGRNARKAFSILLPTKERETYVEISDRENAALDAFTDRPLTLLVKPRPPLTPLAKDGKVGIRTADHPFTKALADLLPFPITATSANVSGHPPATSLEEFEEAFPDADVELLVVDGGTLPKALPSTVAAWTGRDWNILREGDIRPSDLTHLPAPPTKKR